MAPVCQGLLVVGVGVRIGDSRSNGCNDDASEPVPMSSVAPVCLGLEDCGVVGNAAFDARKMSSVSVRSPGRHRTVTHSPGLTGRRESRAQCSSLDGTRSFASTRHCLSMGMPGSATGSSVTQAENRKPATSTAASRLDSGPEQADASNRSAVLPRKYNLAEVLCVIVPSPDSFAWSRFPVSALVPAPVPSAPDSRSTRQAQG